jgi:hypothetical protein
MPQMLDMLRCFFSPAVGLAAIILVLSMVTSKNRKDAPPVVDGAMPIFGHFFEFIKSPVTLVSDIR